MTRFDDDGIIIWKDYESLLFIAISNALSANVLLRLIEMSYSLCVMHAGINECKSIVNVDRFKRDILKSSFYQTIEKLIESSDTDLLDYNESVMNCDRSDLQEKLIDFSEIVQTSYCFILAKNRIICATDAFFELDKIDKKLLIIFVNQLIFKNQRDVAIFLPHKSQAIAYRLITLPIIKEISIGMLCGRNPSFDELESLSQEFWQDSYEMLMLISVEQMPKSLPQFHSTILSFLLLNKVNNKYYMHNAQQVGKGNSHRSDILKMFFYQTVESDTSMSMCKNVAAKEIYYTSDYHKCYAMLQPHYILCVLFISAIPTHAMRFVARDLYQTIVLNKSIEL
jgi:protein fuzzy